MSRAGFTYKLDNFSVAASLIQGISEAATLKLTIQNNYKK